MSDDTVPDRQHVVNESARPKRTPAGDAFTDVVVEVASLGGIFTVRGEAFARLADQSLARWVILDAIEDAPATVASVAHRRGIARQAVQRVADLLVRDGLAEYGTNPSHRRAKLLRPTQPGREALRVISTAQTAWADALGEEIGEATLLRVKALLEEIRDAVARHEPDAG